MQELLPEEIADNNFEECISLCESAIQMFRDLKRMHHPVEVVQMHELASQFLQKGINVNVIRVPDHES
ncbi:fumarate reductase subunit D [Bacillus capparidis]|uniref:Fumarate reductase subunit D n=2 Tax=Bacillus capparidis TaxID=1840411 RepID=A0ABS4D1H2_9BACI|nr:fumarate reductase subunit D [Bacillus capparidis]